MIENALGVWLGLHKQSFSPITVVYKLIDWSVILISVDLVIGIHFGSQVSHKCSN